MTAYTLKDVRDALKDNGLAAKFGRGFLNAYAATAFGTLPKTEIDLVVFSLLVELDVLDVDGASYRIARALNITPTKARSLLFQYQLRNISEEGHRPRDNDGHHHRRYWKDGDKLSFGVSSPLVKAAVSAKMEEKGVFADVSLSGNILRVDPGRFGEVLASLISKSQADRVVGLLEDKQLVDDKTLKAVLGKKGGELATKFIEKVSDAAAKKGSTLSWSALGRRWADLAVPVPPRVPSRLRTWATRSERLGVLPSA